ncbi:MAG: T9SS type A sorting domain-containing protein [Calditrichia bacterium]
MRGILTFCRIVLCVMLINGSIGAQTQIQQLFNRTLTFDAGGLTSQTVVQLLDDGPASTRGGYAQKNMTYFGDTYYLVSRHQQNGDNDIYLRTSSDGFNWSARTLVNDDPGVTSQRKPVFAVGGDPQQPEICVIWQDQRDPSFQLWAAVSIDGGQTFSSSAQISDHTSATNILADVARDAAGNFYVVWNRAVGGGSYYQTWFSRTTYKGQTWLPKAQVHSGRVYSFPSQIVARGNGELLIGICDDQNSKNNLVVYSSSDSGDNWQLETQATNYPISEGFRYFSMLKDDADTIHFLFEKLESGQIRSYRHMSTADWGGSWSTDRPVSDTTLTSLQNGHEVWNAPGLAITPNGTIYAAWADKRSDPLGANYEAYLTRSTDGGQTWMPEIQVNEMSQVEGQGFISIAVKSDGTNDIVSAVWTESRSFAGSNPPSAFTLVNPANNTLFSFANPISFGWQQSIDPDGDPVSYDLRIWDVDMQYADTTISGITTINRGFNAPGYLKFGGEYRWTVRATDGSNTTAAIDTFTLRIMDAAFPVSLQQPTSGSQLPDIQNDIQFSWLTDSIRASGPIQYEFHLFDMVDDTVISAISAEQLSFNGSTFLRNNSTYQWYVSASDGFTTAYSDTFALLTPSGILDGEYTIGNGGNFLNFSSAVNVLNTFGVNSPTTFKVLPGTYNERFEITSFPGQGEISPVVFEAQNGDVSSVLVEYQQAPHDVAIVNVESSSYVTIRRLSFNAILSPNDNHVLIGIFNSANISVEECIFTGPDASIAGNDYSLLSYFSDNVRIQGNTLTGNGGGIAVVGNDLNRVSGIQVLQNNISGARRISLAGSHIDAPLIDGNNVEHSSSYPAVNLIQCINRMRFTKNRIHGYGGTIWDFTSAVRIRNCYGSSERGLIANNMILFTPEDSIRTASAVDIFSSGNLDIFYNTVHIRGSTIPLQDSNLPSRYGLIAWGNTSGLRLKNNIFSAGQNSWAYNANNNAIIESDYNALYSQGRYLAYIGGSNYKNLHGIREAHGFEMNSLSAPPRFFGMDDLHAASEALDGAGTPLNEVLDDFDGEGRDPSAPDIGADEYVAQSIGLTGIYKVGEGAHFATLTEAIEALHMLGINETTTISILPGTYKGSFVFSQIAGAGSGNHIVFQSHSGRVQDVVLAPGSPGNQHNLIRMRDARYLTFQRLTMGGTLHSSWLGLIRLEGDSDNISFLSNNLSVEILNNLNTGALIYAEGDSLSAPDSLRFIGNVFEDGFLLLPADENLAMKGLRIERNRFDARNLYYFGLRVEHAEAAVIQNNFFNYFHPRANFTGLSLFDCGNGLQMSGNRIRIDSQGASFGVIVSGVRNETSGNIFNNFISVEGDSGQVGLHVSTTDMNIYHNSINLSGGIGAGPGFESIGLSVRSSDYRLQNNVLANMAGGFALVSGGGTTIQESDYNDFYTSGASLARIEGTDYVNLAEIRTATGWELNSLSADPRFLSNTDLHLNTDSPLGEAGTPLLAINRDIDRQPRSSTAPDIGADEFTSSRIVLRRRSSINLSLPQNSSLHDVLDVHGISSTLLNGYVLSDVNVLLDTLVHPDVADLDIFISHAGIRDTLVYSLSGNGGDFLNTIFDDSAGVSIEQGSAPFSGRFRPSGSLAGFEGSDPEGEWEIEIVNRGSDTTGVLQAWGLQLEFEYLTSLEPNSGRVVPEKLTLEQNYPNPFNPNTTIRFALPEAARPRLVIYNALGQFVDAIVFDRELSAGWHQMQWKGISYSGDPVSSGIYFYRLEMSDKVGITRKMLLIR